MAILSTPLEKMQQWASRLEIIDFAPGGGMGVGFFGVRCSRLDSSAYRWRHFIDYAFCLVLTYGLVGRANFFALVEWLKQYGFKKNAERIVCRCYTVALAVR